jgi:hypothetical protein
MGVDRQAQKRVDDRLKLALITSFSFPESLLLRLYLTLVGIFFPLVICHKFCRFFSEIFNHSSSLHLA